MFGYTHYHNFEIFGQNLCLSIYLYLFRCEIFMKNICVTIFHYIGYQSFNTTNISTYRYITEVRDLQCHCCIKLAILMIVHFRTNVGLWFRHYRLWYNQLPPLIWFHLSHISRCTNDPASIGSWSWAILLATWIGDGSEISSQQLIIVSAIYITTGKHSLEHVMSCEHFLSVKWRLSYTHTCKTWHVQTVLYLCACTGQALALLYQHT